MPVGRSGKPFIVQPRRAVLLARGTACLSTRRVLRVALAGFALAVGAATAGGAPAATPVPEPSAASHHGTPRIVAFGDVHGDHAALVGLLRAADIIDEQLDWRAGATQLVSLGDLLDRGPAAIEVVELLIKLQAQAPLSGGRVHVVLGNHELMNLLGDIRYVPETEFQSFAKTAGDGADGQPPGRVERHRAFAADGRYGRWLLEQPAAVVVGDTAFVHGGLPPAVAGLDPDALNARVRERLVELLELRAKLEAAGVIEPFGDVLENALALRDAPVGRDQATAATIARFVELATDELFADGGVQWYRGTALCHDLLERPILDAVLDRWQVRRVVIGHTPTWDSRVRERFDGRALLADTGMLHAYYGGRAAALVIEPDTRYVLYADDPGQPVAPVPRAGLEFDGLDTAMVETLLARGTLAPLAPTPTSAEPGVATLAAVRPAAVAPGATLVTSTADGESMAALFQPGSRAEVARQLAAYRLDRLLGLGLVAPVVEREYDGKRGVVSARWSRTLDERARTEENLVRPNWCARGNDYQLMYVFDALINNRGRTPDTMLYDRRTWQFAIAGHARSFARGRDLPAYLANAAKVVPPALAEALRGLDAPALQAGLGDLLSRAEQTALLQRRDQLLTNWTTEAVLP